MTRWGCARCAYQPEGDNPSHQLNAHAEDADHPQCLVCRRSLTLTELQTCAQCVAKVRRDLADIVNLYALLPHELGRLKSAQDWRSTGPRSDETPIPGSDALVMLAGGSKGRSQDRGVMWNGRRDYSHEQDENPTDPPSIAAELGYMEDDWRHERHEPAATSPATVAAAANYLMRRLGWAASHHLLFDEFAGDIHRIAARLRSATGRDDRPEKGAPCIDCGATLVRQYRDRTGRDDDWTCPRCGREFKPAEYALCQRAMLEAIGE